MPLNLASMSSYDHLEFEDLLLEADELIRSNKIADAIHLLEGMISQAPDYGKAYNHLGWVYETKLKEYALAETMYKQCLAYHPEYPPVYLNLSIVLSTLGKHVELEQLLTKGLKVPGVDKAAIYNEFGILYEMQLDYVRATQNFKLAIQHSFNDLNIDNYLKSINRCRIKTEVFCS